jgi:hypothetical protein
MKRLLLATTILLNASVAGAQDTTESATGSKPKQADVAEWVLVVISDVYRGYTTAFSPVPMTQVACIKAAKGAYEATDGVVVDATCLNTRTGAYLPVSGS